MIKTKKFWENQGERVKVPALPDAIANGFIIDLRCPGAWEEFSPSRESETRLDFAFPGCINELHLVSEGRSWTISKEYPELYIYCYKTSDGEPVYLQKQYAEYFIRRYPGCQFFSESRDKPVAVELKGELVGAVSPVASRAKYIRYHDMLQHSK